MSALHKHLPFKLSESQAAFVLILFHTVGIIGLSSFLRPWILPLTSFNLLLSLSILLAFHPKYNIRFWIFAVTSFFVGFTAEWIGVHTGWLFGHYTYGTALGWKLDKIPLIIGINWLMLTIVCGELAAGFARNKYLKAAIGALMMTGLDYLIEPVAIELGYWHWFGANIPLSNYWGWFLISFPLQILYQWSRSGNNPLAKWLFLSQVLFFIVLQIL